MESTNPEISRLRELCQERISERYVRALWPEAHKRLDWELELIENWDHPERFLVAADLVEFVLEHDIPVRLVGAGCSSITAYCLGLSVVDPITHGLLSERFIGPTMTEPVEFQLGVSKCCRKDVEAFLADLHTEVGPSKPFRLVDMNDEATIPHVAASLLRENGQDIWLHTIPTQANAGTDDLEIIQQLRSPYPDGIWLITAGVEQLDFPGEMEWATNHPSEEDLADMNRAANQRLPAYQPKSVSDLAAVMALRFLEGSLRGITQKYLQNSAIHDLPKPVAEILMDTRGIILFQEQIMTLFHNLGGIEFSEAYWFIREAAKKKLDRLDECGDRFLKTATENIGEEAATGLLKQMKENAPSSRPRAHYVAEVVTTYQGAYLSARFPSMHDLAVRMI